MINFETMDINNSNIELSENVEDNNINIYNKSESKKQSKNGNEF